MTRQLKIFQIPLERTTDFELSGDPVHVEFASFEREIIEFWAEYDTSNLRRRKFRVYETGLFLPKNARYVGSTPRNSQSEIYHLYEILEEAESMHQHDGFKMHSHEIRPDHDGVPKYTIPSSEELR